MEEDIKTKADLYKRLRPAMAVRIKDIKKTYGVSISTIEVFEYLEQSIWTTKTNLTLSEIVEDIFNLDVNQLFQHVEMRRQNDKN